VIGRHDIRTCDVLFLNILLYMYVYTYTHTHTHTHTNFDMLSTWKTDVEF